MDEPVIKPRAQAMPENLRAGRVLRQLLGLAAVVGAVGLLVLLGPGLGSLRTQFARGSPGWLAAGLVLEALSALSYVVIFRAVFCPRMGWRLSYTIAMAEQAVNSVLSVSGAGGLALGAWALRRGGMGVEHIARRSVAFFLLTSMANVGGVIIFALLYAVGVLGPDPDPLVTYGFGAAAVLAVAATLALPRLLAHHAPAAPSVGKASRLTRALRFARHSLGQGVRDGLQLLRRQRLGVLSGSLGWVAFDIAVLGVCFKAFGYSPPIGVLVLGYLIGQLGGNVPLPAGIGGIDGGLIATFAVYHQPLVPTTAAVLVYHAIALWLPALPGSIAFVRLRRTLERAAGPAAICTPLANEDENRPHRALAA
jgi:uncharacterized membrane protein YbhN (UPF0104 family)